MSDSTGRSRFHHERRTRRIPKKCHHRLIADRNKNLCYIWSILIKSGLYRVQPISQLFSGCSDNSILFINSNDPENWLSESCVRVSCNQTRSLVWRNKTRFEFNARIFMPAPPQNTIYFPQRPRLNICDSHCASG